jgi:hypothetical protein
MTEGKTPFELRHKSNVFRQPLQCGFGASVDVTEASNGKRIRAVARKNGAIAETPQDFFATSGVVS